MRALLSRTAGGPETLVVGEIPDPVPGPGQVVIAVKACGVNYPDLLVIEDRYQFKPQRPFSPGGEVSGLVEGVGAGVQRFRRGDRVIGSAICGGMAEKIAVEASRCTPIPDRMPFDEAAAFLLTYATSYHALKDRAELKAGETLLVLGAGGGVGLSAVELGRAMGARVVAAASSQDKLELAKSCGADEVLLYPSGPFDRDGARALAEQFKSVCGAGGADVVYDGVGGDYSQAALRAIAWGGRFLVVGFPAGIASIPLNLPLLKSCQIVGVFWGEFANRDPAASRANNEALLGLYSSGSVRPRVSQLYPLEQATEALVALGTRRARGKLVVMIE